MVAELVEPNGRAPSTTAVAYASWPPGHAVLPLRLSSRVKWQRVVVNEYDEYSNACAAAAAVQTGRTETLYDSAAVGSSSDEGEREREC